MKKMALLLLLALSAAPASAKEEPKSRVVTADQRKDCRYLGLITAHASMGRNKAGGALRKALAQVDSMGGNGLFITGQEGDWASGASVNGEALNCP